MLNRKEVLMKSFSIEELTETVGGVLVGSTTQKITGLEQIESRKDSGSRITALVGTVRLESESPTRPPRGTP